MKNSGETAGKNSSVTESLLVRSIMMISVFTFSMCQLATAATFIRCKSADNYAVTITLDSMHQFSTSLNCISGKFIADMTPCAPSGGFGLSAPTGIGALVGVVWHWQDYGKHFGGVTGNQVNGSTIWFNGGAMVLNKGFREEWSFSVDRLTGDASLTTFANEFSNTKASTVAYKCSAVKQKF